MKKAISTPNAPAAIGPYSQAIEVGNMVFTSGVIPVVPATGEIPEGIEAQAKQAIGNLVALLAEAGVTPENVVKTTVFIKNMESMWQWIMFILPGFRQKKFLKNFLSGTLQPQESAA